MTIPSPNRNCECRFDYPTYRRWASTSVPEDGRVYCTECNYPRAVQNRAARRIEVEEKAGNWLYLGNRASERGEHEKAERHYARSQKWHDKMNELETK